MKISSILILLLLAGLVLAGCARGGKDEGEYVPTTETFADVDDFRDRTNEICMAYQDHGVRLLEGYESQSTSIATLELILDEQLTYVRDYHHSLSLLKPPKELAARYVKMIAMLKPIERAILEGQRLIKKGDVGAVVKVITPVPKRIKQFGAAAKALGLPKCK